LPASPRPVASGRRRPLPAAVALTLAVIGGVALPFAFAPIEWWPLAPLALLALFAALQEQTPRRALLLGWLFGVGYHGIGVNWVYHSLHLFGAAVAPLAVALTVLFVFVMTVFPAIGAWLWVRAAGTSGRPVLGAWVFAAIWTLGELARGKIMGGFPWILAGYSQTSGPLGALAPVGGVYGIGFLLVAASALALPVLSGTGRVRVGSGLALGGIVASGFAATLYTPSTPVGEPLRVRLVQANIPQEMKFSRERLERSLGLFTALTRERSLDDIDLVVWPETAIPTYFERVDEALAPFVAEMDGQGVEVLSGGFHREGDDVWNSVRQLGGERALYRKRHLVPFGEYMPLRFVLDWFARFIDIPMSDLSEGRGPHVPLDVAGVRIGMSICYEDVYGEEMRALLPASTVLVNVSNDAWFGDSFAPHQHEQKARMRAREFARPLVRVTNTGVSSSIRPDGSVVARIAHDTQGILDVEVQPRDGATLYARTGNWPVFLVALAVLLSGWSTRHGGKRRRASGA